MAKKKGTFRAYWKCSCTKQIESDVVVEVTGDRVIFEDDQWNPLQHCFFTREQCERFHAEEIRQEKVKDAVEHFADKHREMVTKFLKNLSVGESGTDV